MVTKRFTKWWMLVRGSVIPVAIAAALFGVAYTMLNDTYPIWPFLGAALSLTLTFYTIVNYALPRVIETTPVGDSLHFGWRFARWLGWTAFTVTVLIDALLLYLALT